MRMRLLCSVLLILSPVLFTGCDSQDGNQSSVQTAQAAQLESAEDLKRQGDELQAKIVELEWENADLKREKAQREAAIRARAEAANREFSQDAAAGIWIVKMKCTESSCGIRDVGAVITEVWNLTFSEGRYSIEVINGASNTNRSYSGYFTGKSLQATYSWRGNGWDTHGGAEVTVDLTMTSESMTSGTRKVLNSNPCSIEYAVTATRQ